MYIKVLRELVNVFIELFIIIFEKFWRIEERLENLKKVNINF